MDPVENLIIKSLYGQRRALMIKEIAQICGLERHTITRRLDKMEILGQVRKLEIGNSKRYYLSNTLPTFNLVDICSDLILVINEQWKIQYINKSAQELFNLLDRPVIGERVDMLNLEFFSSPPIINGLKRFDPRKISKIELSHRVYGIERWYEVSIMNIAFRPGITSIVLIAVDTTEREDIKKNYLKARNDTALFLNLHL
jgi:PAS domain-containing protein